MICLGWSVCSWISVWHWFNQSETYGANIPHQLRVSHILYIAKKRSNDTPNISHHPKKNRTSSMASPQIWSLTIWLKILGAFWVLESFWLKNPQREDPTWGPPFELDGFIISSADAFAFVQGRQMTIDAWQKKRLWLHRNLKPQTKINRLVGSPIYINLLHHILHFLKQL